MSKLIYCGPYYDGSKENEIIKISKGQLNNAPNRFQLSLIEGLMEACGKDELLLVNTLPIGTWPAHSSSFVLKNRQWKYGALSAFEVGCVNLPLLKQKGREYRLFRLLNKVIDKGDCILLYSGYLPFMNAISRLKKEIYFSIIVTDLPEFYDLGKTSYFKRQLRKLNNIKIYKRLKNVDAFVLLTEQMKTPLKVGNRPYIIVEGICNREEENNLNKTNTENNTEKKIIFYSGTLHYQFGIQTLMDVFEKINGNEYELWICGRGEAANNITELAQKDKRIRFFGFCDSKKVRELRSSASVLVNPRPNAGEYTKYSFPSKTMEYLASGIPVVMFHLPGIPPEYNDYIYYADENYGNLFDTLMYVLNHPQSAEDKAMAACKFIYDNKSSLVQAEKIIDFLRKNNFLQ